MSEIRDSQDTNPPWHARLVRVLAGPLAALVVAFAPWGDSVGADARLVAATGALMAIWWMTEALPIAVTALLPIVMFPVLGVSSIDQATAPYAHPLIYLFLGGFVLALALQRWQLHRRVALLVLSWAGTRIDHLIGAFMLATAFLSMWISNTATSIMMLPIAVSIIELCGLEPQRSKSGAPSQAHFAAALMLSVAYGANIGGVATLIGSPPNALLAAFLRESGDMRVTFGSWLLVGLPIALVMLALVWILLTRLLFVVGRSELPCGRQLIAGQLRDLGPMTAGERRAGLVFLVTAAAWICYPALNSVLPRPILDETVIAIVAAVVLFAFPSGMPGGGALIDWEQAKKLPWEILLLFGGGLSLAGAIKSSGLSAAIGDGLAVIGAAPFVLVVVGVTLVVTFMTEVTSNTATAAAFLPIVASLAIVAGHDPLALAVPVTLAASFAFMLPVATPPNAVVYGSGYVTIRQMAGAGFALNLIGVAVAATLATYLVGVVFLR